MVTNNLLRVDEEFLEEDDDLFLLNGEPFTGIGYLNFDSGNLEYETSYKNGLPHGYIKRLDESGQLLRLSECRNGLAHGRVEEWYKDGNLKKSGEFEYGVTIWSKEWDSDGRLTEDYSIENDPVNFQYLENERKRQSSIAEPKG